MMRALTLAVRVAIHAAWIACLWPLARAIATLALAWADEWIKAGMPTVLP